MAITVNSLNPITSISNQIESVLSSFISNNVSNITNSVISAVAIGMTIILIYETLLQLQHPTGNPLTELFSKFFRWGIILSIASAGGWYQQSIANAILRTPDELANAIISSDSATSNIQVSSMLDATIMQGHVVLEHFYKLMGVFSNTGIISIIMFFLVLIVLTAFVGAAAFLLLVSKMMLTILIALGGLAILCKLFKATNGIFDKWVGGCISCGMILVLLSVVFTLCNQFFLAVITSLQSGNSEDLGINVGTLIVVVLLSCGLFAKIPFMAIWLGSGFHSMFNSGLRGFGNRNSQSRNESSRSDPARYEATQSSTNSNSSEASPTPSFARGSSGTGLTPPKI